jgi:hypothetical protein
LSFTSCKVNIYEKQAIKEKYHKNVKIEPKRPIPKSPEGIWEWEYEKMEKRKNGKKN